MPHQKYRIITLNINGLHNPIKRSKVIAKMIREEQSASMKYSAFTMATKALYILPHFHPFTHSFIHQRWCQPYKAPSSSSGAAGVWCLCNPLVGFNTAKRKGGKISTWV